MPSATGIQTDLALCRLLSSQLAPALRGAIASRNKARIEAVLALLVEAMPVANWTPERKAAHVESILLRS